MIVEDGLLDLVNQTIDDRLGIVERVAGKLLGLLTGAASYLLGLGQHIGDDIPRRLQFLCLCLDCLDSSI